MTKFVQKLLLITTLITIIDSVVQIFAIFFHKVNQFRVMFFLIVQVIRTIVGCSLLVYCISYKHPRFIYLAAYWLYLLVVMFTMGSLASYKDRVWSLNFQLINQYMAMILVLYSGEDAINKSKTQSDSVKTYEKSCDKKIVGDESSKNRSKTTPSFSTLSRFDSATSTGNALKITIITENQLVIATLVLLPLTFAVAYQLHGDSSEWTERQLMYLKFPGELFLRTISALMVPLIITSLAFACTSIDLINSTDILYSITLYFAITTILASVVGITTVLTLGPNPNLRKDMTGSIAPTILIIDIFLDTFRNIFTDSLPGALTGSYFTVLTPPTMDENSTRKKPPPSEWKIGHKKIEAPNVSGLILFSMSVGLLAGRLGEHGKPIVDFLYGLNTILMTIIVTISYCAPIGTFFIILPQVIEFDNIPGFLMTAAWFSVTVIIGLAIHLFVILSGLFFLVTQQNPFKFIYHFSTTISKAFGTDCCSVALADAMNIMEKMGFNKEVIAFCVPLGSTLNMDGAALYQSVAAIFLSHHLGIQLSSSQILSVFITSALISVGAAGMPQASLISIIIVLETLGLKFESAALVIMVDSLLDRFRTIVNVFSDVFGAAIVSYMFRGTQISRSSSDLEEAANEKKQIMEVLYSRSRTPDIKRLFSSEKYHLKSPSASTSFLKLHHRSVSRIGSKISRFHRINQ